MSFFAMCFLGFCAWAAFNGNGSGGGGGVTGVERKHHQSAGLRRSWNRSMRKIKGRGGLF